ncbi:MAG: ketoacyl-ACP synthase III [Candidatus Eisenbacteria bacterium]|uniref:Beta-ketoacyl-[acyl-carrier-protein] synthase III n=1 Tax=Eiseniibacteriota bacterium TaxID=2212470 RepID=A0A538T8J9_UNCEI|nr:MAG: ketoacyl-ACP synthase III [Candidatus Eisenbacteria bacterium]
MISSARDVHIIGVGSCTPDRVLTNKDLEQIVDTSDEWITTRTGIKERRIADPETPASALATEAARRAVRDAGVKPEELDQIIVGTVTGDRPFPSTACLVQDRLGAAGAYGFDISAACSGFLYALSLGRTQIAAGAADTVLVIGVETLSKIVDWTDRNTCVLFGDAAGAVVLRSTGQPGGILSTKLHSDGSLTNLLEMPGGGSLHPASHETVDRKLHYIRMSGNDVFKYAVRAMESVACEALEAAGHRPEELDLLFPHQANYRIIDATARRLGLPMEKVFVNLDRYGNTSSASIPLALDEAKRLGRLKPGDLVEMVTFGGGFTWAASVVRW